MIDQNSLTIPVSIILLGEIPPGDKELLKDAAGFHDAEVTFFEEKRLTPSARPNASGIEGRPLPQGCISFLPYEKQFVLQMLAAMPLGLGREIPYFQKVDPACPAHTMREAPVFGLFHSPLTETSARNIVAAIVQHATLAANNRELMNEIARYRAQKMHLIKIGAALSSHHSLATKAPPAARSSTACGLKYRRTIPLT
jgi:hypothetical protein